MEDVLRTRLKLIYESVQSCITSAQCELKKLSESDTNLKELELIGSKLKGANQRFVSEIHNYCQSIKEPDVEEISRYTLSQIQAEDLVSEIVVTIKRNNSKCSAVTTSGENMNITSKLPRMELSKFDGDVLKWYQFWDQFSSNVDSRNINEVDKLLYLQSVLEGDAKQAIEGLDTTNTNYSIAVKTLKDRYGKPSAIIDAHYVALYRIKTARSNQVKDCRQVLNEIERHLRVLSSLGEDVNHNHLRVMIMEKFPEDLIYELRMKMTGEDEKIDSIRKYLEYIISARETSNRLKKNCKDTPISEGKPISDNFTLGSMHVRTEEKKDNKPRRFTTFKKDKPNSDAKPFNKSQSYARKRPYDSSDRTDEPSKKKSKCIFCKQEHFNDECTTYKTMQDRKSQIGSRCYNCFREGHRANLCRFKRKCRHCNEFGTHNRALCPAKLSQPVKSIQTDSFHVRSEVNTTLLQTCIVEVSSSETTLKPLQCRVLLDCGSQRSYITEATANTLQLSIAEKSNLSIFTFGAKSPHQIESPVVNFKLMTRTGVSRRIHANVVPHITHGIRTPVFRNLAQVWSDTRLKDLKMADDGSCGDKIDILIGNDYYHSFMSHEKISVTQDLFLVNSDFGWVWSGKIIETVDSPDQLTVLTYFQSDGGFDNKLNEPDLPLKLDDVKRLWDLESIGITDSPKTTRDEEAVNQFNETIQYENERYHVQWPWTESQPSLPNNLGLAWGRLNSLVKRLDHSEREAYDQVIQEQLQNGIIEMVPDPTKPQSHTVHYLPHHCVHSRDRTKKLRIVYDASAKSADNRSLNECLYRGPLMLEDLTGLLIKFREHPIGIVADVEKAFLQLGLQNLDRDVTRFLWLKDINGEARSDNVLHLRFCRVPFGVISSPFLLNATIRFHLTRSDNILMKNLADDIYVDNIVTGAKTVSEAINLYESSKESFNSLSMNLREWNSNSNELISLIPDQFQAKDQSHVKVLGLMWDIQKDLLYLKSNSCREVVQSKRDVLKTIAAVYDPCGFAVPVVLPAKLFFQKLWKEKVKWDVKLNENLLIEWQNIASKFAYLEDIHINRYYAQSLNRVEIGNPIDYELHCFTDSSMDAYAAVIYLRSSLDTNNIVSFVIGKSRLVPLKDQINLQIPRLELLGVLIGCRLITYVTKFLRIKIKAQILWTDSQIVLSWYSSDKLLPPFVSRRINEIRQNKTLQVRYVPTKLNPADIGTRADRVDCYDIWLKGPDFLTKDSDEWPTYPISADNVQTQISLAGQGLANLEPTDLRTEPELDTIESTILDGSQQPETDETNTILDIQTEYFPKEVEGITTDLSRSLQLFKDTDGILRCKGRFKYTDLTENQKEPILLPKNSEFTHKVISELHQKNYHVGVSHTLALLRQKFWVPHGRSTVQKVIRKCLKCVKYGGGPFKLPAMPDLPEERVKLSLPFAFTGLDYFGPLLVNDNMSQEKRWVCLFTCLTVRAIHMEVVKDLSAEECTLAIRRFVAVRGLPRLIVSDNATQFKLTADVLTSEYCIQNKLRWRFIPELAPWFGGFYERLIGLVKHSMKRTLDKHLINHNQLCTAIKELEAIVNTRPLTTVGAELEHVLTPQDFLRVGGPVTTDISDRDFLEPATITKTNLIDGWKRGQIIITEFTKMFTNQYLTSLRERNDKHRQPRVVVNRAPKISETVQIRSDGSRAHWKVGKIAELIKGSDGQVRVARIKVPSGETFTRSIGHLFPLEVEEQNTVPLPNQNDPTIRASPDSKESHVEHPATPDQIGHSPSNNESSSTDMEVDESMTQSSRPEVSAEPTSVYRARPIRASAAKARQKVKEWTSQLMIRLFEQ